MFSQIDGIPPLHMKEIHRTLAYSLGFLEVLRKEGRKFPGHVRDRKPPLRAANTAYKLNFANGISIPPPRILVLSAFYGTLPVASVVLEESVFVFGITSWSCRTQDPFLRAAPPKTSKRICRRIVY